MSNRQKKADDSLDTVLWNLDKKMAKLQKQMNYDEDWDDMVYESPDSIIPNHHCWSKDPNQCNKDFGKLKPEPYINLIHNAPIQRECKAFDVGVLDPSVNGSFDAETIATSEGGASLNSMEDGKRVTVHYTPRAASPVPMPFLCCISGD